MRSARLMLDAPASGSWNMAVDQALLESVGRTGKIALRFYRWEQPTLTLGYFQRLNERNSHPASLKCPVVRRSTGGGAILHDQEITYSLCVPSSNRWAEEHEQLYWTVHGCIIDALQDWGVEAGMYLSGNEAVGTNLEHRIHNSTSSPSGRASSEFSKSFLCFQRRSKGDIVWGVEKICGSAQRRNQNSILQHGSLIFGRSLFAPELPGIDNLSGRPPIGQGLLLEGLVQRISEGLRVEPMASELDAEERYRAKELEPLFGSVEWLNKLGRLKH